MSKSGMEPAELNINSTDIKIALAIGICMLTSTILSHFGLKYPYGDMKLEIIQKMTASIACLLCVQGDVTTSAKAGWNRIKITLMGGIAGVIITVINQFLDNEWMNILLIVAGVILALFLCKLVKVPYMNCRIGGVTFILVACTLSGNARILYAIFRLISTIYGVLAVMFVTWIFGLISSKKC